MKVAFFSTRKYDKQFFNENNASSNHEMHFLEVPFNRHSAVTLQNISDFEQGKELKNEVKENPTR